MKKMIHKLVTAAEELQTSRGRRSTKQLQEVLEQKLL